MIVLYNFIRNITIAGQIWIKKQVCTKRRGVALNYSSGKKKKERKTANLGEIGPYHRVPEVHRETEILVYDK
jgi:hypothetical protein